MQRWSRRLRTPPETVTSAGVTSTFALPGVGVVEPGGTGVRGPGVAGAADGDAAGVVPAAGVLTVGDITSGVGLDWACCAQPPIASAPTSMRANPCLLAPRITRLTLGQARHPGPGADKIGRAPRTGVPSRS
jgi:hypothetical protein